MFIFTWRPVLKKHGSLYHLRLVTIKIHNEAISGRDKESCRCQFTVCTTTQEQECCSQWVCMQVWVFGWAGGGLREINSLFLGVWTTTWTYFSVWVFGVLFSWLETFVILFFNGKNFTVLWLVCDSLSNVCVRMNEWMNTFLIMCAFMKASLCLNVHNCKSDVLDVLFDKAYS